ncbi:MAG: methyl-accepting chemotaxis protein [Angelakisella sp.]
MCNKIRTSIKAQVTTVFVIVLLLLVGQGVSFAMTINHLSNMYELTTHARAHSSDTMSISRAHYQWKDDLNSSVLTGAEFQGSLDPTACSFGKWLIANDPSTIDDEAVQAELNNIIDPHTQIHLAAKELLATNKLNHDAAVRTLDQEIGPRVDQIISSLNAISDRYNVIAGDYSTLLQQAILRTQLIMGTTLLAVLLIFIAVAVMIMKLIVKPVVEITSVSDRISRGDLSARAEVKCRAEICVLAHSLNTAAANLQGYIAEIGSTMEQLADNNFSVEIEQDYVGDFAAIKSSINRFLAEINDTMHTISSSSGQVHSAAANISSASTEIAHGASKQSGELGRLTDLLKGVARGTELSAENASRANALSHLSGEKLQQSNEKMQDMLAAIEEITVSAKKIEKIIKAIDDIAFQTNILALNAAVEAARAGAAGKGFAVVADEVRNLANKSAVAANTTTELIRGSISSVGKGSRIAEETAEALSSVIETSTESMGLVSQISDTIEQQAADFHSITTSAEDISVVVEHNSAASEECAAAGEELEAQSELLKALVEKFTLRETFDSVY